MLESLRDFQAEALGKLLYEFESQKTIAGGELPDTNIHDQNEFYTEIGRRWLDILYVSGLIND